MMSLVLILVSVLTLRVTDGRAQENQPSPLDRVFRAIETIDREIPRDTFDLAAVVERVGKDPRALERWVRENTALVPYRGVLRGARGVLMDRVGNSLDRALLLQALLERAGHSSRLAKAPLPDELAKALLVSLASRPLPQEPDPSGEEEKQLIDRLVAELGFDRKAFDSAREARLKTLASTREGIARRVQEQREALAKLLGPQPVTTPSESIAALKDHWWILVKEAQTEAALDPTVWPDPSLAPRDPASTCAVSEIPADLWHSVRFHLVIETWVNGVVSETVVATTEGRAADLLGVAIEFFHRPQKASGVSELLAAADPQASLLAMVRGQGAWWPSIRIGERIVEGKPIDNKGLQDAKRASPGGGAFFALGDAFANEFAGEAPKVSHLTAAWIDFEILAPGEGARKIRRQIFDVLGPALRTQSPVPAPVLDEAAKDMRAMALAGQTRTLVFGAQLSETFVTHAVLQRILSARAAFTEIERTSTLTDRTFEDIPHLPGPLLALALARSSWSPHRGKSYVSSPNILNLHERPILRPGGELVLEEGLDIVSHALESGPAMGDDPFLARLEHGLIDTNIEATILEGSDGYQNAAVALSDSLHRGEAWVAITPETRATLQAQVPAGDFRARLEKDLSDGRIVVIPRAPSPSSTWFSVDPLTGRALGHGPRGWGQATTEAALLNNIRDKRLIIRAIFFIACIFKSIAKAPNPYVSEGHNLIDHVGGFSICLFSSLLSTGGLLFGGLDGARMTLASDYVNLAGLALSFASFPMKAPDNSTAQPGSTGRNSENPAGAPESRPPEPVGPGQESGSGARSPVLELPSVEDDSDSTAPPPALPPANPGQRPPKKSDPQFN